MKQFAKLVLSVLFLGLACAQAQERHLLPLYRPVEQSLLNRADTMGNNVHPGVRPLDRRSFSGSDVFEEVYGKETAIDRVIPTLNLQTAGGMPIRLEAYPLFTLMPGFESGEVQDGFIETAIGLTTGAQLGDKLDVQINFLRSNSAFPIYMDRYIIDREVVPGQGNAFETDLGYHYRNSTGYVSYRPGKHFTIQAGRGKHQWGEGYRSLMLSDFADNYEYLKVTTDFWKIRYVNLWTRLRDITETTDPAGNPDEKYGAFHYLSLNVTKRWNISLFEGVVWAAQDSLVNRGFDYHYLNPIILYRPVEFSIGSPDNMLVGLSSSFFFSKRLKAYGQLVFDEFLLSELRSNNGWWGNKYSLQGGLKYYHAFGVDRLTLQGELNVIRPYTYSHSNPLQAFGHMNEPLAHPMGANGWEAIMLANYSYKRVYTEYKLSYQVQGRNPSDTVNVGNDPFLSSSTRVSNFNNELGQGDEFRTITSRFFVSYLLSTRSQLRAEFNITYHYQDTPAREINTLWTSIGLRMALFNQYYDF